MRSQTNQPGAIASKYLEVIECVVSLDQADSITGWLTPLMTEPGGWLQWGEFDLQSSTFITTGPDVSPNTLKEVAKFPRALGKTDTRMDPRYAGLSTRK